MVTQDEFAPFTTRAQSLTVETIVTETLSDISTFSQELNKEVRKGMVYAPDPSIASTLANNCPENTALDTLLDPIRLNKLQQKISMAIGLRLMSSTNKMNSMPTYLNKAYGIDILGFSFTVSETRNNKAPAFVVSFDN